MVGTVVGLTLLALATLLVVEREGELGQPVALTALGVGIVLAGLGIMVSGLRGRRSGVLGFLAVVGILVSFPVAFGPGADDRFAFTTLKPMPVQVDGEVLDLPADRAVTVTIAPGALATVV